MSQSDNKRIAKNTVFLYIRMIVLICVQLYASRIVLNALGFDEYGLYSIVGAIVVFLGFINISMASASQRFLAFAHGRDSLDNLRTVFKSVVITQSIIAGAILIFVEIGGSFYIQYLLKVSSELRPVAHIVFQMSLLTVVTKTMSVPYTASIIANERMNAFAALSLLEGGLQLCSALSLTLFDSNRIIWYSVFMAGSVIMTQLCYFIYCRRHFKECRGSGSGSKKVIKEIFSYSGWNLLGSFSSVAIDQGVNMILNSFFGVIVNAARGIAFQVSGGIASLSSNFQQAINPQIVKSYAGDDLCRMQKLIKHGTRMCFFLLLVFALPVLFNINGILTFWLKEYPPLTPQFCQLVLINALITSLSGCLMMGAMATGNIKKYQIIVASINISNLPFAYLALRIWPNPLVSVYIMIIISIIGFGARLLLTSRLIKMSVRSFLRTMSGHIVLPTALSAAGCLALKELLTSAGADNFISGALLMFILVAAVLYASGLSQTERQKINAIVLKRIHCQ